jgi:hypothetical protein
MSRALCHASALTALGGCANPRGGGGGGDPPHPPCSIQAPQLHHNLSPVPYLHSNVLRTQQQKRHQHAGQQRPPAQRVPQHQRAGGEVDHEVAGRVAGGGPVGKVTARVQAPPYAAAAAGTHYTQGRSPGVGGGDGRLEDALALAHIVDEQVDELNQDLSGGRRACWRHALQRNAVRAGVSRAGPRACSQRQAVVPLGHSGSPAPCLCPAGPPPRQWTSRATRHWGDASTTGTTPAPEQDMRSGVRTHKSCKLCGRPISRTRTSQASAPHLWQQHVRHVLPHAGVEAHVALEQVGRGDHPAHLPRKERGSTAGGARSGGVSEEELAACRAQWAGLFCLRLTATAACCGGSHSRLWRAKLRLRLTTEPHTVRASHLPPEDGGERAAEG